MFNDQTERELANGEVYDFATPDEVYECPSVDEELPTTWRKPNLVERVRYEFEEMGCGGRPFLEYRKRSRTQMFFIFLVMFTTVSVLLNLLMALTWQYQPDLADILLYLGLAIGFSFMDAVTFGRARYEHWQLWRKQ